MKISIQAQSRRKKFTRKYRSKSPNGFEITRSCINFVPVIVYEVSNMTDTIKFVNKDFWKHKIWFEILSVCYNTAVYYISVSVQLYCNIYLSIYLIYLFICLSVCLLQCKSIDSLLHIKLCLVALIPCCIKSFPPWLCLNRYFHIGVWTFDLWSNFYYAFGAKLCKKNLFIKIICWRIQ